jgi:glyoxalase family protein
MPHRILGLHHVTATVDQAQPDLDFCMVGLGLRLVKKTVNFDNHHVYHFYYGTERGAPGTIWTTFPYAGRGVRHGVKGAGQVTATAFSVPRGSVPAWKASLQAQGIAVDDLRPRFDDECLQATDPSGLTMTLIATDGDRREPWAGGGVGSDRAIRGLHSVEMVVRDAAATLELMTGLLGFEMDGREGPRIRLSISGAAPGTIIDVIQDPGSPSSLNGLGTVHHVAMAIGTRDEQLALRTELVARGFHVTEVLDRQYFTSIYFREPGGVLFEVATAGPGFAIDEPAEALGMDLMLPPWEEPNRPEIEAGLPAVSYPIFTRHC